MNQQIGTVFELKGGLALSDFRAARALASLRKVSPLVEAVSGRFVHFVHAERALTDDERARLEALLTYGDPAVSVREDLAFMVVPRLGTISPWASKASDIVKNCGIQGVARVERGTIFSISLSAPVSDELAAKLAAVLHDRMTESAAPRSKKPTFRWALRFPKTKSTTSSTPSRSSTGIRPTSNS